MAPWHWSYRAVYLVGFLICAALMAYALYAEYHLGLMPCPLCIFQRVAFIWMGVWFLIAGLHAPRGGARWVYCVAVLLGAAWGIAVAARHLYLQSLPPDQVPSCGPGLNYMLQTFPFAQTLRLVFHEERLRAQGHTVLVHLLGRLRPRQTTSSTTDGRLDTRYILGRGRKHIPSSVP